MANRVSVLDELEGRISSGEEPLLALVRAYVMEGWSGHTRRVRRFLGQRGPRGRAETFFGLALLGTQLGDPVHAQRHAVFSFRLEAGHPPTRALFEPEVADALEARAERSKTFDRIVHPLRDRVQAGELEGVLETLRPILEQDSHYHPAQRVYFEACRRGGDVASARAAFALLEDPTCGRVPELALLLAKVIEGSGGREEALGLYLRTLVEAPKSSESRDHVRRLVRADPALRVEVERRLGSLRAAARDTRGLDLLEQELEPEATTATRPPTPPAATETPGELDVEVDDPVGAAVRDGLAATSASEAAQAVKKLVAARRRGLGVWLVAERARAGISLEGVLDAPIQRQLNSARPGASDIATLRTLGLDAVALELLFGLAADANDERLLALAHVAHDHDMLSRSDLPATASPNAELVVRLVEGPEDPGVLDARLARLFGRFALGRGAFERAAELLEATGGVHHATALLGCGRLDEVAALVGVGAELGQAYIDGADLPEPRKLADTYAAAVVERARRAREVYLAARRLPSGPERRRELSHAAETYEIAAQSPGSGAAWAGLNEACVRMQLGEWERAAERLEQLEPLLPRDNAVRASLALAYARLGQHVRAMRPAWDLMAALPSFRHGRKLYRALQLVVGRPGPALGLPSPALGSPVDAEEAAMLLAAAVEAGVPALHGSVVRQLCRDLAGRDSANWSATLPALDPRVLRDEQAVEADLEQLREEGGAPAVEAFAAAFSAVFPDRRIVVAAAPTPVPVAHVEPVPVTPPPVEPPVPEPPAPEPVDPEPPVDEPQPEPEGWASGLDPEFVELVESLEPERYAHERAVGAVCRDLERAGKFRLSEAFARACSELNDLPRALLHAVRAAFGSGRHDEAIAELTELTGKDGPLGTYGLLELVACLYEAGRPDEGLAVLQQPQLRESRLSRNQRGLLYELLTDRAALHWPGFTGTEEAFRSKQPPGHLRYVADDLVAQGRAGDALWLMIRYAADGGFGFTPLRALMAELYLAVGAPLLAVESARIAMASSDVQRSSRLLSQLGDLFIRHEVPEAGGELVRGCRELPLTPQMVAALAQLAARDPSGDAWIALVRRLLKDERRRDAISTLRQAVLQLPAHKGLRELADQLGQTFVAPSVTVDELRRRWSQYQRLQRHVEGLELIREQRARTPDDAEVARLEVEALLQTGAASEAIAGLEALFAAHGDRADLLHVARLHGEARDTELCADAARRLLERNPFDPDAHDLVLDLGLAVPTTGVSERTLLMNAFIYSETPTPKLRKELLQTLEVRGSDGDLRRRREIVVLLRAMAEHRKDGGAWSSLAGRLERRLPVAPPVVEAPAPVRAPEVDPVAPSSVEVGHLVQDDDTPLLRAQRRKELWKGFARRQREMGRRVASVLPEICPWTCRDFLPEKPPRSRAEWRSVLPGMLGRCLETVRAKSGREAAYWALEAAWLFRFITRLEGNTVGEGRRAHVCLDKRHEPKFVQVFLPRAALAATALQPRDAGAYLEELGAVGSSCFPGGWRIHLAMDRVRGIGRALGQALASRSVDERERRSAEVERLSKTLVRPSGAMTGAAHQALVDLAEWVRRVLNDLRRSIERVARLSLAVHPQVEGADRSKGRFACRVLLTNEGQAVARHVRLRITCNGGFGFAGSELSLPDVPGGRAVETQIWLEDRVGESPAAELGLTASFVATAEGLKNQTLLDQVVLPPWSPSRSVGEMPYRAGRIVEPGHPSYVHRTGLLAEIETLLDAGNPVLVYGFRRVGKSSILRHLHAHPPVGTYTVSVDMQSLAGSDVRTGEVLHAVAEAVAEAMYRAGIDLRPPPVEQWRTNWTTQFNRFVRSLDERAGGANVRLLIDEFDVLLDKIAKQHVEVSLLDVLRHHANHSRTLSFVLVGTTRLLELGHSYLEALFQLFRRVRVDLLTPAEARWLVEEPLRGKLTWAPEAVNALVESTAGHPMLLQELCQELVMRVDALQRPHVAAADVSAVVAYRLEQVGERGAYEAMFDQIGLRSEQKVLMAALADLATDVERFHNTGAVVRHLEDLNYETTEEEVRHVLEELMAMRLVVDDRGRPDLGTRYAVAIPLLSEWIDRHRSLEVMRAQAALEEELWEADDARDTSEDDGHVPQAAPPEPEPAPAPAPPPVVVAPPAPAPPKPTHDGVPWVTRRWVHPGTGFSGRQEPLRRIEMMLVRPPQAVSHIQIVGARRIGKSSLLQRVATMLRDGRDDAIVIDWSAERYDSKSGASFMTQLAEQIEAAVGGSFDASRRAPERIREALKAARCREQQVFVVLDEFQAFVYPHKPGAEPGIDVEDFRQLRSFDQDPDCDLTYVISSLAPLKLFSEDAVASGFHGIFSNGTIWLGPLTRDGTLALVDERAAGAGRPLPEGTGAKLFDLCGGHPWLTACAASSLWMERELGRQLPAAGSRAWTDLLVGAMHQQLTTLSGQAKHYLGPRREVPLDEAASAEVKAIVRDSLHRSVDLEQLEPAADPEAAAIVALLGTGLCRVDGDVLEPVGKVALLHLKRVLLGTRKPAARLAREEDVQQLIAQIRRVEPRLRKSVARVVGPDVDVKKLGFRQLLERVTARPEVRERIEDEGVKVKSEVWSTIDARNDGVHSRELTLRECKRAGLLLDVLDEAMDYEVQ